MKRFIFKTSKGEFVLIDPNKEGKVIHPDFYYIEIGRLKQITEKQAIEIVDDPFGLEINDNEILVYKDYEHKTNHYDNPACSLYSLLYNEGLFLFEHPMELPKQPTQALLKNMHKKGYGENDLVDLKYEQHQYDLAEEKTFYNPIIFKLK